MTGKLYGVGVGPGDPELLTLKALRLIKESPVIAVPGTVPENTIAYKIVVQAYPQLADKELLPVEMPMTKDPVKLKESHEKGAKAVAEVLDQGKDVAFHDSGSYCQSMTILGGGSQKSIQLNKDAGTYKVVDEQPDN